MTRRPTLLSCTRRTRRLSSVLTALCFVAPPMWLATAPNAARAQGEAARHAYDIPAGPLATTLNRIAREAGLALTIPPAMLAQRQAPAIRGDYSGEAALQLALHGSGLTLSKTAAGSYTVQASPAAPEALLPVIQVSADAGRDAATEGSGSYTATGPARTATRMNLSLRETPQSVSVLTRQQLDDRGISNFEQALTTTPGITVDKSYGDTRGYYYARGAQVSNLTYDGLPSTLNFDIYAPPDMALYDRVEIVRGATGLMQGAGNPSAAINLIRKRPTEDVQARLQGHLGTWDNRRIEADVSGPLNAAGSLRGRAVAAHEDKDSFLKQVYGRSQVLYGIVEADLGPRTTVSLSANLHDTDRGMAWGNAPHGLSRDVTFATDWTYHDTRSHGVNARLEHHFDDDWQLRAEAAYLYGEQTWLGTWQSGTLDYATGDGLSLYAIGYRYDDRQLSLNADLSGRFELFGRRHDLIVGADARRRTYRPWGSARSALVPVNAYHFSPADFSRPALALIKQPWGSEIHQSSFYAASRWHLTDPLKLIAGARLSRWEQIDSYSVSDEPTPYAGLVWEMNDTLSAYASYTSIFQPQSARDRDGKVLPPVEGKTYEAGIKGAFNHDRLNASLSVYRTDSVNRAQEDLAGPSPCPYNGATYCSRAAGEIRSEGVEVELAGAIGAAWQVGAGYTFNKAYYLKDASQQGEPVNRKLPRHLLRLSGSYALNPDWTFGASLNVQSEMRSARLRQGGYAVAGLMARWRLNAQHAIQVNLNNVFDRHYYQSLGTLTDGNYYGEPRNLMVSFRAEL